MKLTITHDNVVSTQALDTWVKDQIDSLLPSLQIDEAAIKLTKNDEVSPPFEITLHLATPGLDVSAEGRDHTLQAAFSKMMDEVRSKISHRATRKQKRRIEMVPVLRPGIG